jgi:hypothetical protein
MAMGACHEMPFPDLYHLLRSMPFAITFGILADTSRGEAAMPASLECIHFAFPDKIPPVSYEALKVRANLDERFGIRVAWVADDVVSASDFHDPTFIHDSQAITHVA